MTYNVSSGTLNTTIPYHTIDVEDYRDLENGLGVTRGVNRSAVDSRHVHCMMMFSAQYTADRPTHLDKVSVEQLFLSMSKTLETPRR